MASQQSVATQDAGSGPAFSRRTLALFALTSGLSVADIYYSQPLLEDIAREFGMSSALAGGVVTVTQLGYALGLLSLVPLADLINRRRLIVVQLLLSALSLLTVGLATSALLLLAGLTLVGVLAVVIQVLVAHAASMSSPSNQGRAVGMVTSGVALGVILARAVAGPFAAVFTWRGVYLASAALTLLAAAAMAKSLPRHNVQGASHSYGGLLRSMVALCGRRLEFVFFQPV